MEDRFNDSTPGSPHPGAGRNRFRHHPPVRRIRSPRSVSNRLKIRKKKSPHPSPEKPSITIPDITQLHPEELPEIEPEQRLILVPSKAIALEWSLVLTSQHIESTILFPHRQHWFLLVNASDHTRALEMINLYLVENRNWNWPIPLPHREHLFNWGVFYWALPVLFIYLLNYLSHDQLRSTGFMDSDQFIQHHEWWRTITATFLHGDIGHLASNLSLGFLLFGLAMARYGIGWTLHATLLAGICGNLLSVAAHPTHYASLGASGVVMGTLGLLSVYLFPLFGRGNLATRLATTSLAAAGLIFVLTGLSPAPQVNIAAHLGGFLGGILTGLILNRIPDKYLLSPLANVSLTCLWFAICAFCWHLAIGDNHF